MLSRVPRGEQVYHVLQRAVRSTASIDHWGAKHTLSLMQEQNRGPVEKVVLEIGTGWHPILPMLCSLGNARRVVTLDVNRWLDWRYARASLRHIQQSLETFAPPLTISLDTLRTHCSILARARTLRELLDVARIDYRCPMDAGATNVPDASVDVVVSSNVLEHIPSRRLELIHREAHRMLRPGGLVIHRIDLSDHFSHNNPRVPALNFLQFSASEWRKYGGSRLGYQNRLRPSMHLASFRSHFRIIGTTIRRNQATLDAVQQGGLTVASDFADCDADDLAGERMVLIGEKA